MVNGVGRKFMTDFWDGRKTGNCPVCAGAGDEVVQWNGIRLRGLTFEEVYDIIFESKFDPQVELTVYRPVGNAQQQRRNDAAECFTEGLSCRSPTIFT